MCIYEEYLSANEWSQSTLTVYHDNQTIVSDWEFGTPSSENQPKGLIFSF